MTLTSQLPSCNGQIRKMCTRCGISKLLAEFSREKRAKDGVRSNCKSCGSAYTKAYVKANHESVLAKQRERFAKSDKVARAQYSHDYYRQHATLFKARAKQWKKNNHDRELYLAAQYRINNKERITLQRRAWLERNRQKDREYHRQWGRQDHRKHPWKVALKVAKRKARMRGAAITDFTPKQWLYLIQAYGNRCAYCNKKRKLTQDHVIPLSKGGNHTASNIVPACVSCNSKKRNHEAPTFQTVLGLQ